MLYGDKDLPGQFASAIHLIVETDAEDSFLRPMLRTFPLHEQIDIGISWDRHDFQRAVAAIPELAKMGHDIQACDFSNITALLSALLRRKGTHARLQNCVRMHMCETLMLDESCNEISHAVCLMSPGVL
jgi:hypothetical protein